MRPNPLDGDKQCIQLKLEKVAQEEDTLYPLARRQLKTHVDLDILGVHIPIDRLLEMQREGETLVALPMSDYLALQDSYTDLEMENAHLREKLFEARP